MRNYIKEGSPIRIISDVGPRGSAVLTKEAYMADEAPQLPPTKSAAKRQRVPGPTNEEKQGLSAALQKHLRELRPDLSIEDLTKVGSTFYNDLLKAKKASKAG